MAPLAWEWPRSRVQLQHIDLLVGTFGKALASVGAFLLCSATLREYFINHSRSLIFTTALPPVVLFWNHFIFKEMLSYGERRGSLKILANTLRQKLRDNNLITAGSTNIVPVMLGDDTLAVVLAEAMQEMRYLIFPVRPPTVPQGTSRFRLSLTADMQDADIASIASDLADFDSLGIPEKIFAETLTGFNATTRMKFYRRMCREKTNLKMFLARQPQRSPVDQGIELAALQQSVDCLSAEQSIYQNILIAEYDWIVPSANQRQFWLGNKITEIAGFHFLFYLWSSWDQLLLSADASPHI